MKAVKVVIYDNKILPSLNFRLVCWISSTGNWIYHWKEDAFFLKYLLFVNANALSLNYGEKILSSHDFFQLSRTTKSKKISLKIFINSLFDFLWSLLWDIWSRKQDFFYFCWSNKWSKINLCNLVPRVSSIIVFKIIPFWKRLWNIFRKQYFVCVCRVLDIFSGSDSRSSCIK